MLQKKELVLASQSPQRLQILKNIGIIPNHIVNPNCDETPLKKERPYEFVKRISKEKATSVKGYEHCFIIAADTIIVKGLTIIGKPKNIEDAKNIMQKLSGGRHKVLTSFSLIIPKSDKSEKRIITKAVKTSILVKKLQPQEIDNYLATNQWENRSGGYAIQGYFELFIKQINGSLSNVIGLPSQEVYNSLIGEGYKPKLLNPDKI